MRVEVNRTPISPRAEVRVVKSHRVDNKPRKRMLRCLRVAVRMRTASSAAGQSPHRPATAGLPEFTSHSVRVSRFSRCLRALVWGTRISSPVAPDMLPNVGEGVVSYRNGMLGESG
ncbi:MAG: hypothetical protein F4W90_06080 [Gammaproteobacteria bacterium]|nr:hypothetical protein [Gammaproteobacteria bacterium]